MTAALEFFYLCLCKMHVTAQCCHCWGSAEHFPFFGPDCGILASAPEWELVFVQSIMYLPVHSYKHALLFLHIIALIKMYAWAMLSLPMCLWVHLEPIFNGVVIVSPALLLVQDKDFGSLRLLMRAVEWVLQRSMKRKWVLWKPRSFAWKHQFKSFKGMIS